VLQLCHMGIAIIEIWGIRVFEMKYKRKKKRSATVVLNGFSDYSSIKISNNSRYHQYDDGDQREWNANFKCSVTLLLHHSKSNWNRMDKIVNKFLASIQPKVEMLEPVCLIGME